MASLEEAEQQIQLLVAGRSQKNEAGVHKLSEERFMEILMEVAASLSPQAEKAIIERAIARTEMQ